MLPLLLMPAMPESMAVPALGVAAVTPGTPEVSAAYSRPPTPLPLIISPAHTKVFERSLPSVDAIMGTKKSNATAWPVGSPMPLVRMGMRAPLTAADNPTIDVPAPLIEAPLYLVEAPLNPPCHSGVPEFISAGL